MQQIIGRQKEKEILEAMLSSEEAELMAIYGRRRIGKTFLIHEFFKDKGLFFECSGVLGGRMTEQLWNFSRIVSKAFNLEKRLPPPKTWKEAFEILSDLIDKVPDNQRVILFFDELPWLATRRSDLLRYLEYFWNQHFSRRKKLIMVLCGSAASWMIKKIIHNRGGLHGRLTRKIYLEPFSLFEAEQYLKARGIYLDRKQLTEIYMVTGGVAKYLGQVQKGLSSSQVIHNLCFESQGFLKDEFHPLFASLFGKAEHHLSIVKYLAKSHKGKTLQEICKNTSNSMGGGLTRVIKDLEASGFIKFIPFYGKSKKEGLYRLIDEYTLFYLKWIEKKDTFYKFQRSHDFLSWAGYAFENICIRHIYEIISVLKLSVIAKSLSYWEKKADETKGAQIDFIIDRTDQCLNLIEVKFSEGEFLMKKDYAEHLNQRRALFSNAMKRPKPLFNTLITSFGAKKNPAYLSSIDQQLSLDDLFIPKDNTI